VVGGQRDARIFEIAEMADMAPDQKNPQPLNPTPIELESLKLTPIWDDLGMTALKSTPIWDDPGRGEGHQVGGSEDQPRG
jgi:hypothetical protein